MDMMRWLPLALLCALALALADFFVKIAANKILASARARSVNC
jgi:uncharacterized membrane protein